MGFKDNLHGDLAAPDPEVQRSVKGGPDDYAKSFAGELGDSRRPGYDEPLSVGVGQGCSARSSPVSPCDALRCRYSRGLQCNAPTFPGSGRCIKAKTVVSAKFTTVGRQILSAWCTNGKLPPAPRACESDEDLNFVSSRLLQHSLLDFC